MHGISYVGINMPTQACGRQWEFYFALTGLEEDIGDIIPRALPWAGLFCPCRAEDGFAIAALGFASCPGFAGMT